MTDNARWTAILRGNYSRKVSGRTKKKTIRPIDFQHIENNRFTVTNQFRVESQHLRHYISHNRGAGIFGFYHF
ncbi:MAG: hypothetical protein GY801_20435 [bacterium]|nr:hypothetical protein [bacterium]